MSRGVGRLHDAARRSLAEAACDVIARDGIQALTVRRAAEAAGVSPGRVQHYFADRTAIVLEAFRVTQQDVADDVAASLQETSSPAEMVRAVLRAMIPVDALGVRRLRIMMQFETLSLSVPEVAALLRDGHAALRRLLADAVAASVVGLSADAAADQAQRLLATGEGLGNQVLLGQESADRALALMESALDDVLGKETA